MLSKDHKQLLDKFEPGELYQATQQMVKFYFSSARTGRPLIEVWISNQYERDLPLSTVLMYLGPKWHGKYLFLTFLLGDKIVESDHANLVTLRKVSSS